MNRWKFDYINNTDKEYDGSSLVETLAKHFIISVDFIPSEDFWVDIGFNPKVSMNVKLKGGGSFSGFSAGAGVRIKMLDVGFSLAEYCPFAMSMMTSVPTTLVGFKKVTE